MSQRQVRVLSVLLVFIKEVGMQYEEEDLDEKSGQDPLAVFHGCAVAMLMSLAICLVAAVVLVVLAVLL